jgi:hypothetical protein
MIAPLRETNEPPHTPGMLRARRLAATILLRHPSHDTPYRHGMWKAWLVVAGAVAVAAILVGHWLGWI